MLPGKYSVYIVKSANLIQCENFWICHFFASHKRKQVHACKNTGIFSGFSFYGDSFAIVFSACALPFYGVFSFGHKA